MKKTLAVYYIVALACFVVLIISLEDSKSIKSVFYNGTDCDSRHFHCPSNRPNDYNVEKGIVYASNIIQTEQFELWTNLSIWMESSRHYCHHLTHVPSGLMKDAQNYLNLFDNSTSYLFATTFTSAIDNACNPDNIPDRTNRGLAGFGIVWFVLVGIVLLSTFTYLVLYKEKEIQLQPWMKIYFITTLGLTLLTAGVYVATHYSYCSMNGRDCSVAPTGILLQPHVGTLFNWTCMNTSSCSITWTLQHNNLENPNGTCVETVHMSDTFSIPLSKPLFLNPSTKTECRSVPSSWNFYGWIRFGLYGLAFFMILLMIILISWALVSKYWRCNCNISCEDPSKAPLLPINK